MLPSTLVLERVASTHAPCMFCYQIARIRSWRQWHAIAMPQIRQTSRQAGVRVLSSTGLAISLDLWRLAHRQCQERRGVGFNTSISCNMLLQFLECRCGIVVSARTFFMEAAALEHLSMPGHARPEVLVAKAINVLCS